jgi:hypothetical protein
MKVIFLPIKIVAERRQQTFLDNAPSINGSPGVTYDCIMPGKTTLPTGTNSSAVFNLKDTALVCYASGFSVDFGATDPDKDSLSYELSSAYQSDAAFGSANDGLPALEPPYNAFLTQLTLVVQNL